MKKLSSLLLAFVLSPWILSSCSRGSPTRQMNLTINFAEAQSGQNIIQSAPDFPDDTWAARAIISSDELQCFAVAVTDTSSNPNACELVDGSLINFASLQGFVGKSESLMLDVSPGQKSLYVIGVKMADGIGCKDLSKFEPRLSTQMRVIAKTSVVLKEGDSSIKLPINFNGEIIKDCAGPAIPKTELPNPNCNSERANIVAYPGNSLPGTAVVHFKRGEHAITTLADMKQFVPNATGILRSWTEMSSYLITFTAGTDLQTDFDKICSRGQVSYAEPVNTIPLTAFSAPASGPQTTPNGIRSIASIGSGIEQAHPYIAGNNLIYNIASEIPGNGLDDDGDGYVDNVTMLNLVTGASTSVDDEGLSTAEAGWMAFEQGSAYGAGPWAPVSLKIYGYRIWTASTNGTIFDTASAIEHARATGLHAIFGPIVMSSESILLRRAMFRAYMANMLVVTAAYTDGQNDDLKNYYPGAWKFPNVMVVGGLTDAGTKASFSRYGSLIPISYKAVNRFGLNAPTGYSSRSENSLAAASIMSIASKASLGNPNLSAADLAKTLVDKYKADGSITLTSATAAVAVAVPGIAPPALLFYPE